MTAHLDYILYGLAFAAVIGVVLAFKRDALMRARRTAMIGNLKIELPAKDSYQAAAAEVDDNLNRIQDGFLLQEKNPYGNHLSISGEPHGYYGRNRAGPGPG